MTLKKDTSVEDLKNIGGASADYLHDVGVHTLEDLKKMGVVEAFVKVKRRHHHKVDKVFLYAMQGALMDVHWNAISDEMKSDLLVKVEKKLPKQKL